MLVRKVQKFIEEQGLLHTGNKVLVALSGGADSVALLRVLLQLGYPCEAVHCNFHLRGEESNRDENFVRELCGSLNVSLYVTHFDTESFARNNGVSIEMAARTLRYNWFDEMRRSTSSDVVAVAHHRDDSVETFLLNLSRGTGINGLKGILPKNGFIIRPMLDVCRKEILDYLEFLKQNYVTDSTNLEDVYTRNKIRLDIIPRFCEINPSFSDSLNETARRLGEVALVYKTAMEEALRRVKLDERSVSIPALLKEVSPESVLYEWLFPIGFNSSQIKDIVRSLGGESGRLFYSKNWELLRDRSALLLREKGKEESFGSLNLSFKVKSADYVVVADKHVACLDADKVRLPLTLRKWQSGDRFMPYGMNCFKKVRDYMRDRKYSLFEKESQYVVLSDNEIIWLVDERPDNRYCVTENTQNVLELRIIRGEK